MTSGPAWGARLFLVLATTTIVIANYHQQHDNSVHGKDRESFPTFSKNVTRHHGEETSLLLPPVRKPHLRHHHVTHWGPYFEDANGQGIDDPQNVTLHLGATALLDCRVAMLADKMVMWVRRSSDRVSLLTVGRSEYSSDPRYSVSFQYPNNWRLSITSVQREDHGLYDCQVSTHPPRMLSVNVIVLAPHIKIVDEVGHEVQDRYYKTGSSVELACIVRPSTPGASVPQPVWQKNGGTLPDHVNVYHANGSDDELVTRIRVESAKKTDSGEYTCSLSELSTTMVHLHVLNGEKQAAVHHDQWSGARTNRLEDATTFVSSCVFLLLRTIWSVY